MPPESTAYSVRHRAPCAADDSTCRRRPVPGYWGDNFSEVYLKGVKVKSFRTDDGNAPQYLVLNVGKANTSTVCGRASTVKVGYARAPKT